MHVRERPSYLYLAWDGMRNKDAPDCLVRARLGPVRGGRTRARLSSGAAEEEVERELAEMNLSLEQLAGLEEKEEGRVGLRFMAQRPVCASISR